MLEAFLTYLIVITNIMFGKIVFTIEAVKIPLHCSLFALQAFIIIKTYFKFDEMDSHMNKVFALDISFITVLVVFFGKTGEVVFQDVVQEQTKSMKEREIFDRMLDGLQQGVVVIQDDKIDFMNDLSNKVISQVTDEENFLQKYGKGGEEGSSDPLDLKIFNLFENKSGPKKKLKRSNSKRTLSMIGRS